jgi:hypothetical protein
MTVEPGKCYYVIVHAYHHFIGEVIEVTGRKSATFTKLRWVYSSTLNWTEFFKKGCTRKNSTIHDWPDGEIGWENGGIFNWKHPIPE